MDELKEGQDDSPEITCEVHIICLDDPDHARYAALSYTWGDPMRSKDNTILHSDDVPEPDRGIYCRGRRLPIGQNLYDALIEFRRKEHTTLDGVWFWVDAICINQNDIEERSAQVRFMASIYSRAFLVVIWLGEADEHSQIAIPLIRTFRQAFENCGEDLRAFWDWAKSLPKDDPSIWARLGMQRFDDAQFHALTMFYARRWFVRLWTIQEFLFSQSAVAFCGNEPLDFEDIRWTTLFITWSDRNFQMQSRPESKIKYKYGFQGFGTVMELNKYRDPFTQNEPTREGQTFNFIGGFALSFEALLVSTSRREATDPKDYVFAKLAMAMAMHSFTAPTENMIVPDYSKTIEDIYIETTRFVISSTQALRIITWAQQPEFRDPRDHRHNLQGLPSWVPQYNFVGGKNLAYISESSCRYTAMGNTQHLSMYIRISSQMEGLS